MAWNILCSSYFVLWQEGMAKLRQHRREHGCKYNCGEERGLMAKNAAFRSLVHVYSALSEKRR